ncbi:hypothetical protein [uncultured Gammaproteobacteria bacterium]|nr:hypothetical protein [uncultured Gammaproteobacteria bacterium]
MIKNKSIILSELGYFITIMQLILIMEVGDNPTLSSQRYLQLHQSDT